MDGPTANIMALLGGHAQRLTAHVEVAAADPESARLLEVPPGTPMVEGRHVAGNAEGALAYLDLHVLRGEYLKFEITLRGPRARGGRAKRPALAPG